MEKRPEAKNDLYYSGLSGSKQGYSVDMTRLFFTFVLDGLDDDV